jgi:hypothetical protein
MERRTPMSSHQETFSSFLFPAQHQIKKIPKEQGIPGT